MKKQVFFSTLLILAIFFSAQVIIRNGGISKAFSLTDCSNCNVVLIVVDTLRADHLSTYGYPQVTDPFLKQLSEKSVVFTRAFSASSWTAPATASIFTSLYPSQHRVITGLQAITQLKNQGNKVILNQIPKQIPLLPELMKKSGFQTIGISDNVNIGKEIGFVRGFQHFKNFKYKGAKAVNDQARRYLNILKDKGKYFLYIHYMDPHQPYHKRDPWYSECLTQIGEVKQKKSVCAYNSEIRHADNHIGGLVREFDLLENSIIIVTSDHGEEFFDHGDRGHGHTLYRELIHVPLIVYHPNIKPQQITTNVHTMDILPTISSVVGFQKLDLWQGRDLAPLLEGKVGWEDERSILSERYRAKERLKPEIRSLIKGESHYIHTYQKEVVLNDELFNIENDFHEQANIYDLNDPISQSLSGELISNFTFKPFSIENNKRTIEPDAQLLKQLRTLGYVN